MFARVHPGDSVAYYLSLSTLQLLMITLSLATVITAVWLNPAMFKTFKPFRDCAKPVG